MIITSAQKSVETRQNMRGGQGQVDVGTFVSIEQYPKHCRLFSELSFEKGCGIGQHTHEGESEFFYVLSGELVYNDDGKETAVVAGDVCLCLSGHSHSVRNEKFERAVLIAVIIKEME